MATPIRVLIIEDSDNDKELLLIALKRGGYDAEYVCVETAEAMTVALDQHEWDIIISDYSMPRFNGLQALQIAKDKRPDLPFILISGTIGEELAVQAMKEGAGDYLMKGNIKRLIPAIERELKDAEVRRHRKIAEEALKESEIRFRVLTESAPVGIFTTDSKGGTNYVNPRWCEISQLNFEESLGFGWLKATHPDDRESLASGWQQISNAAEPSKMEYRFLHPDGTEAWVIGQAVPQKDGAGNLLGYIGTITDITERKKMEADLIASKEKAEESDRLKTAFLHNISHEIRTPLNSIVGFSRLITEPDIAPEELESYAEIINKSSDNLIAIIADIIDIATIEAGQDKLNSKEINVNSLCARVLKKFTEIAQKQNISLICNASLPDNDANIVCDDAKLFQVFNNLIGNALKFTKQGTVSFGYQPDGDFLKFYVQDTGIGIAPEMHHEIFKRFRQVESTATRKFGGSGLGLAISKANIELHGGRIWVESEIGKGATFYFTIPCNHSTLRKAENISPKKTDSLQHKALKILITEDEEAVDTYLSVVFRNIGREILHAENGLEAVEICRNNTDIDLILMDIKMPELDGYEATREIRKFNKDVIIIAQTAYALEGDREKTIEAGCNDYISKPIRIDKMMEILGKYFK
jgi:PAS domain S-box-containing protein